VPSPPPWLGGVGFVGVLPPELQIYLVFSANIGAMASKVDGARTLLTALTSPSSCARRTALSRHLDESLLTVRQTPGRPVADKCLPADWSSIERPPFLGDERRPDCTSSPAAAAAGDSSTAEAPLPGLSKTITLETNAFR
jgi:hypothetical protein